MPEPLLLAGLGVFLVDTAALGQPQWSRLATCLSLALVAAAERRIALARQTRQAARHWSGLVQPDRPCCWVLRKVVFPGRLNYKSTGLSSVRTGARLIATAAVEIDILVLGMESCARRERR